VFFGFVRAISILSEFSPRAARHDLARRPRLDGPRPATRKLSPNCQRSSSAHPFNLFITHDFASLRKHADFVSLISEALASSRSYLGNPCDCSFPPLHSYVDPSSGAALATRELLEWLATRGMDCRALCTGVLDYDRKTTLDEVITSLGLPAERFRPELTGGRSVGVFDLTVGGARVALLPAASSRAERSPSSSEGAVFLDLAGRVLDRFRPDVLLTYGGHPVSLELMRRASPRDRGRLPSPTG